MSYFLGLDGGGTKTECVAMNLAGEVVARVVGGPSNSARIGVDAAVGNVVATADAALREARLGRGDISAIGAALAGTTDTERCERVRVGLQAEFPNARVVVMTDLDAALAAAPDGPAVVLVAGTGSAAIGRNRKGQVVRVGGYGRFLSDEGSAFDVGRRAITAAMQEREKHGWESRMGAEILRERRCRDWNQLQERAQRAPDDVYPATFPVIAAAADAGDELARQLLCEAAMRLCSLVAEAATQLGLARGDFALVKTGGMLGRSKFFDRELAAALREQLAGACEAKLRTSPAQAAALAVRDAHG